MVAPATLSIITFIVGVGNDAKSFFWQFKWSMQLQLKVQWSTSLISKSSCYNLSHNPSIGSYMCFSVQLKYVQLHTVICHQSRQVLVACQCPLETALVETHGRLGGFAPWWEEAKLHMPTHQSSA